MCDCLRDHLCAQHASLEQERASVYRRMQTNRSEAVKPSSPVETCRCTHTSRCRRHERLLADMHSNPEVGARKLDPNTEPVRSNDFHVPEPELATGRCICGCLASDHDEDDPTACMSEDGCGAFVPAVSVAQARQFAATRLRLAAESVHEDDTKEDVLAWIRRLASAIDGDQAGDVA